MTYNHTMINLLKKCDVILIKSFSNLNYLSGYANADAVILIFSDKNYYLTDARYTEEAAEFLRNFEIIDTRRDLFGAMNAVLHSRRVKSIGIENDLPMDFFTELNNKVKAEFIDISEDIRRIRTIKTPEQVELIKKAQTITDKSFDEVLPLIKEGMTERQLCLTLENLLYYNGADGLAFKSIVAFGEHTSRPHALVTDKKLENSSIIKLDFGAMFKGYCSDMTRTVFFGKPTTEQAEIYNAVKEAQQLALDNIYPGMSCKAAYAVANGYFARRGLDGYFIHSLGHGLGTDVHEAPALSPRSEDFLTENMVVSVEPGLYFPGRFGIRIEDIILFHKSSIENLTKSQKEMIIL
ncbi:MAG: aminopeptidase P family protein [Clostridia bacterium]|nr:aminopeptidase P family protein [Clostridia bacterium]